MARNHQLGFSVLHALPMVAIIALISFVGVKVLNASHAATSPYAISCLVQSPSSVNQGDTTEAAQLVVMNPSTSRAINSTSGTVRERVNYKYYNGTTLISSKYGAATTPVVGKGTYLASGSSQVLIVTMPGPSGKTGTWKVVLTPQWQRYANGAWTTFVSTSCTKSLPIQATTSAYAVSCTVTGPASVKFGDMANDVPVTVVIKNSGKAINSTSSFQEMVGTNVMVGSMAVSSSTSGPTNPTIAMNTPLASGATQNLTMNVTGPGSRSGTYNLTVSPHWQVYSGGSWVAMVGTSCKYSAPVAS